MNLHSNFPFWLLKNGIVNNYLSVHQDQKCDVAIIGAGISGALSAWYLGKAGIKTIVLDKRHTGTGSTCSSTALLQYEIDVPLIELIKKLGETKAVESYHLCLDAIAKIGLISKKAEAAPSFFNKPSLQFASHESYVEKLALEYECRKKHGFPVYWLKEEELVNKFGFNKAGAIFSDAGAGADAYKMTHDIFKYAIKHYGAKVFDKTRIAAIQKQKSGFELRTADGFTIHCKKVIIACGYESQQYLPEKVEKLHSTYVIAGEPLTNTTFWYKDSLIWETAQPYLYIRSTKDNRIIVGGKDIPYSIGTARDRLVKIKAKALERSFALLFPTIPFKTDFSWAGTFAGTKDGLPYIGEHKSRPGIYFALDFGGNGITFSSIAGELIRDSFLGKRNKNLSIFKFGR